MAQREVGNPVSNSMSSLMDVFASVRLAIEQADSAEEIETLHRRAVWLLRIVNAPSWERSFGEGLPELRIAAAEAFAATERTADDRARRLGVRLTFDVSQGPP
jgi:hypothetical protein